MPEGFGARLRHQREKHEIALATIAERTKIKVSLLEELERDDISHWPTGIFRRAFVRGYAASIGIDQETAVREFLEQFPEPVETDEPSLPANGDGHAAWTSGPPTRFRYLVTSLLARLRGEDVETPESESLARSSAPAAPSARISRRAVDFDAAPELPLESTPLPEPELAAPPVPELPLEAPDVLDLQLAARICTDFSRLDDIGHVAPLLEDTAKLLCA